MSIREMLSIEGLRARAWALLAALLFSLGCGGGGGGGSTSGAELLGRFEARLSGAEETSVSDAEARGFFLARILDDGTLEFWVAAEPDWVGDITDMHIHRGAAGVDGDVEVDLLGDGATFDGATATATDTLSIDPALAAEIAANPAAFYVNIHTTDALGGFVRAQLGATATFEWHATLRGDEEVMVVEPNARGAATFSVNANGTIDYVIATQTPLISELTLAHIHVGGPGVAGVVEIDLDLPNATFDEAAGTAHGTISASPAKIARVLLGLEGFYVNVHSDAAPDGVARGQLATGMVEFWAQLRGDEETDVVDADARGGISLEIDSFTTGLAVLAVPPAQGIAEVNAAHVHEGGAGTNGNPVIDLTAGANYGTSASTGTAEGSIELDQTLLTRMMAAPGAFYANFHTADAANGLVRGQLTRDPETFFAQLSGDEVTVVVDADAEALATVVLTSVHECTFTISMTQPGAVDVTAAHLHEGAAGVDGNVLVSFLLSGDFELSGEVITGRASVTGRTFPRLLAAAGLFYIDVETAAAPNGIARGQMARLSGDLPPSGLTYSSPVTYFTGVLIASNTPTSTGGAISSYSIDPPLPAGLNFNTTTGIISGRPSVATPEVEYVVTATNASGSATASVFITVEQSPPVSLTYGGAVELVTDSPITPLTPTVVGLITNYVVSPALPAGLSINASSGVISGTPTVATPIAGYQVTGSNSAGSVMATVTITVVASLQPPSNLSYSTPVTYDTGYQIDNNTPTISGGEVASWSINPSLPAGLSFSTSTGVISGTPTATSAKTEYTVTATNASGNTTAKVEITVQLGAPTNLSYSPEQGIGYYKSGTFTTMNPSSEGGAVSSYSISPSLPAGLSINSSTGVIDGSPSAESQSTEYTVTASNAAGSTTAKVSISVIE